MVRTTLGVPVIHVRKATLSLPKASRPACHFCGNCMSGCDVVAKYNSLDVHMVPALKTGKLTLQSNSIVYELAVSGEARANEVRYFDRETRAQNVATGKVVVVACACAQSIALLQMSKSSVFPLASLIRAANWERISSPHHCWVRSFSHGFCWQAVYK